MNYVRVMPRDLFNEASLLKCLGKLWMLTEYYDTLEIIKHDSGAFDIRQDQSDGSIHVANVHIFIKEKAYRVFRPLNSKEEWPIWIKPSFDEDVEAVRVFEECPINGLSISEEMRRLLGVYDDCEG